MCSVYPSRATRAIAGTDPSVSRRADTIPDIAGVCVTSGVTTAGAARGGGPAEAVIALIENKRHSNRQALRATEGDRGGADRVT